MRRFSEIACKVMKKKQKRGRTDRQKGLLLNLINKKEQGNLLPHSFICVVSQRLLRFVSLTFNDALLNEDFL